MLLVCYFIYYYYSTREDVEMCSRTPRHALRHLGVRSLVSPPAMTRDARGVFRVCGRAENAANVSKSPFAMSSWRGRCPASAAASLAPATKLTLHLW